MDDDVVTETSWWLAPGDPQQVLAGEKAHLPSLYRYFGGGTTATGVWNDVFNIAAVPGLFDERELAVSTTAAGGGQTAIRVDALVDWIPVRPGGDKIPATATNLALVLTSNVSHTGQPVQKVTATATITDAATVGEIAAYLSTVPAQPPGAFPHGAAVTPGRQWPAPGGRQRGNIAYEGDSARVAGAEVPC